MPWGAVSPAVPDGFRTIIKPLIRKIWLMRIRAAGAPAIVETPGGVEGQSADIALLREKAAS